MDELRELMETYEAELRGISDTYGGRVDVWRAEPAEVVQLRPDAIADDDREEEAPEDQTPLDDNPDDDDIEEYLEGLEEFETFNPDDDDTVH